MKDIFFHSKISSVVKVFVTGIGVFITGSFIIFCGREKYPVVDYDQTLDTLIVPGDWLIHHELSDPDILNPITSRGASSDYILGFIFETLMSTDNHTLELKPFMALSLPTISTDQKTYIYRLRQDVRFSDGHLLTGDDLLFSVKVIKNPYVDGAPLRSYYQSLKDVTFIGGDPFYLKFVCEEPYFKNDELLGGIPILPKHLYDPRGLLDSIQVSQFRDTLVLKNEKVRRFGEEFNRNDLNRHPLGSGAYQFLSWETNQQIMLARHESWWHKGDPEAPNYLERIIFRTINDMDAALVALKNQDLDIIAGLKPIQYTKQTESRKFEKKFRKTSNVIPVYTYIGWNQERPFFADSRVRWAMSYLTDVPRIIEVVMQGLAVPVTGPIFYKRTEYDTTLPSIQYNLSQAVALLNESDWQDHDGDGIREKVVNGEKINFVFTFLINSGNEQRKQIGLILSEELKKVGIKAAVRELEWSVFLNEIEDHHFDATILGWAMGLDKPDPYQIWHSSQVMNRGSNAISFKHKGADSLLELNRRTFDEKKRINLMRQFQHIIYNEQPYTFLFSPLSLVAVHKRFRNITWYPFRPGYDLHEWGVPRSMQRYTQ